MENVFANMLSDIGSVVTAIAEFCGDFITQLTSNPLTLVMIGVPIIGMGLGFVFRLLRGV